MVAVVIEDMRVCLHSGMVIYCDNCGAIEIVRNDIFHEHTEHIEINCHFIRSRVLLDTARLISTLLVD